MSSFTYQGKIGDVFIRRIEEEDLPRLIEMNKKAFPLMAEENVVWSERQLKTHLKTFPAGQLVAMVDGEIVGAIASLIVNTGRDPYRPHTYGGITDGGYFHNHDSDGDTLYGADVYVDPDCQGKGIGGALYEARRRLCKQLNLRRILAGGRLSGYGEMASELTPEEYVQMVKNGEIRDNVLSFQLKQGFVVRGILRNYITDPKSRNFASLIEWLNPEYVEKEASSKVRIACVQYQVRKIHSFEDFANQVEYFVETAADYHSDFVLFPEFFSVQLLSILEATISHPGHPPVGHGIFGTVHCPDVRPGEEIRSLHHRWQPSDDTRWRDLQRMPHLRSRGPLHFAAQAAYYTFRKALLGYLRRP